MPPRLHFAVLAHRNEACVADLVRALWDLNPGAAVSIFNGGKQPHFFADQGVPICGNSAPLRYGNLTGFHIGVMRWLRETRAQYDILVTLDFDVMPLRSGLAEHLGKLTEDAGYLGVRFRPASDPSVKAMAETTMSQIQDRWTQRWQPLFKTDQPYWAFNPGQVFTKETVDKMLDFSGIDELMEKATNSYIWAMEEIVYPTLAVAVGAAPQPLPGGRGIVFGHHSPADVVDLGNDPDVFFMHRVGMTLTSPDRRAAHAVMLGQPLDAELLAIPAHVPPPVPGKGPLYSPSRIRGGLRRRQHDWQRANRA